MIERSQRAHSSSMLRASLMVITSTMQRHMEVVHRTKVHKPTWISSLNTYWLINTHMRTQVMRGSDRTSTKSLSLLGWFHFYRAINQQQKSLSNSSRSRTYFINLFTETQHLSLLRAPGDNIEEKKMHLNRQKPRAELDSASAFSAWREFS